MKGLATNHYRGHSNLKVVLGLFGGQTIFPQQSFCEFLLKYVTKNLSIGIPIILSFCDQIEVLL